MSDDARSKELAELADQLKLAFSGLLPTEVKAVMELVGYHTLPVTDKPPLTDMAARLQHFLSSENCNGKAYIVFEKASDAFNSAVKARELRVGDHWPHQIISAHSAHERKQWIFTEIAEVMGIGIGTRQDPIASSHIQTEVWDMNAPTPKIRKYRW